MCAAADVEILLRNLTICVGSGNMKYLRWDWRKKFKPGHSNELWILLNVIIQSEGMKICAEALSLVAGFCEHGNENSSSVIRKNLLTL
jgi:hypothetical protein